MSNITVRNPHSVLAALEARPRDVLEIVLSQGSQRDAEKESERGAPADAWVRVAKLAREQGIRVSGAPKAAPQPGRGFGRDGGRSRGSAPLDAGRTSVTHALIKERESLPIEKLFESAREKAGGKGLWLALDSLQDPQNVGAIFRTAGFFGVQGIVLTQERSAPLSGTVYDVASGGMETVPFTIQVNLQRAFEEAKEAGLWILGTSEHARDDISSIQPDRPWLVVLGNEEKGMRRLTEEACDVLCRISPKGKVTSLNVSVAAGIFISRFSG